MDGILIIDKPAGWTSHDVVAKVRRILGTKRVGHTGTLDPFATGVMVLLIGNATRLARFLDKDAKEYTAQVRFGFETDTGDVDGRRKAESSRRETEDGDDESATGDDGAEDGMQGALDEKISQQLSSVNWENVFEKFRGDILQTPPMYSAKKVDGKKLYELARDGKEIERKAVPVSIHDLELLSHEIDDPQYAIRIRVVCSAGTYIRTLAEEIGRAVGVGAHLINLRRTAAGKFDLSAAFTLEALQALDVASDALHPIELAVSHLPEIALSDDRIGPTRNGLATRPDDGRYKPGEYIRMTQTGGNIIAIGIYDDDEKVVRPKVVLI